jgi:hypothetical protein
MSLHLQIIWSSKSLPVITGRCNTAGFSFPNLRFVEGIFSYSSSSSSSFSFFFFFFFFFFFLLPHKLEIF